MSVIKSKVSLLAWSQQCDRLFVALKAFVEILAGRWLHPPVVRAHLHEIKHRGNVFCSLSVEPHTPNKDSFDRLSEAKERQSYQGLNEPGTAKLSFAFAALEGNPDGWSSQ